MCKNQFEQDSVFMKCKIKKLITRIKIMKTQHYGNFTQNFEEFKMGKTNNYKITE